MFILPTERALLVTQVLWTCAKVNYREVPILISVSMDTVHLSLLEVSIPEKENTALIAWLATAEAMIWHTGPATLAVSSNQDNVLCTYIDDMNI